MDRGKEQTLIQLRKGVLEFCVLALLVEGPSYGLELAGALAKHGALFTSGGALYPLLTRLRKSGWVETFWRESASGPPRRYYQITSAGRQAVEEFQSAWSPFVADVSTVLRKAEKNGQPESI